MWQQSRHMWHVHLYFVVFEILLKLLERFPCFIQEHTSLQYLQSYNYIAFKHCNHYSGYFPTRNQILVAIWIHIAGIVNQPTSVTIIREGRAWLCFKFIAGPHTFSPSANTTQMLSTVTITSMHNKNICTQKYVRRIRLEKWSQVSGCILQTAQTWANAGVCSASCAHALGGMFVCLSLFVCVFVCLFVCFTGNLGDWVMWRRGSWLLLEKLSHVIYHVPSNSTVYVTFHGYWV